MKFTSITLHNFRNHKDTEFTLYDETVISGANGVGKSSIAEAIVWCLFGTDITGALKQDADLLREGAKDMAVTLTVEKAGEEITIYRERAKNSTLLINGSKAKDGELEGLFGSLDAFLSMFLPGYFSSLSPKEAKLVLASVLPLIPQEEIMKELSPSTRETLGKKKFGAAIDSVDYASEKARKEQKEVMEEVSKLQGEARYIKDILASEFPHKPEVKLTEERKEEAQADRERLILAKSEVNGRSAKIQQLEKELAELGVTYKQLQEDLEQVNDTCPRCGQKLPPNKVAEITASIEAKNKSIKARMTSALEKGKTVKAELNTLRALPIGQVDPVLEAKVRQYEIDLKNDQTVIAEYKVAMEQRAKAKMDQERVQKDLETVQARADHITLELAALAAYRNKYVELQHNKMNASFQHVAIHVVEEGKSSFFKITYKGRAVRRISHSERIRCDLEIGRVLAQAHGELIPVFVDEAQNVQNLLDENIGRQVLATSIFAGPLTVREAKKQLEKKGA